MKISVGKSVLVSIIAFLSLFVLVLAMVLYKQSSRPREAYFLDYILKAAQYPDILDLRLYFYGIEDRNIWLIERKHGYEQWRVRKACAKAIIALGKEDEEICDLIVKRWRTGIGEDPHRDYADPHNYCYILAELAPESTDYVSEELSSTRDERVMNNCIVVLPWLARKDRTAYTKFKARLTELLNNPVSEDLSHNVIGTLVLLAEERTSSDCELLLSALRSPEYGQYTLESMKGRHATYPKELQEEYIKRIEGRYEKNKDTYIIEGWPKTPNGLLDHLNSWDRKVLDMCERPEAYPNYADSGETAGWILMHKEEFAKMGVEIRWNTEEMRYEIVRQREK